MHARWGALTRPPLYCCTPTCSHWKPSCGSVATTSRADRLKQHCCRERHRRADEVLYLRRGLLNSDAIAQGPDHAGSAIGVGHGAVRRAELAIPGLRLPLDLDPGHQVAIAVDDEDDQRLVHRLSAATRLNQGAARAHRIRGARDGRRLKGDWRG